MTVGELQEKLDWLISSGALQPDTEIRLEISINQIQPVFRVNGKAWGRIEGPVFPMGGTPYITIKGG